MLPIQLFRENKNLIIEGLIKRNYDFDNASKVVEEIIKIDNNKRKKQKEADGISSEVNILSNDIGALYKAKKNDDAIALKIAVQRKNEKLDTLRKSIKNIDKKLEKALLSIPNIPHHTVPYGKTPEENQQVRQCGYTPNLNSQKLSHWELAKKYNLIDFELGNKLTGSGFPVYVDQGAKLQRSLISYFLNYNIEGGYKEYYPPYMVNEASARGTGQLPDKEGQMYYVKEDKLYLIPTAEVPVTNIYRDEIIKESTLPIKMTAYTPCFRREAGSYGKDVRGLNRLHQFDKVEIVQICHPAQSYDALEEMVLHVEQLLKNLDLQYRILRLCGGDMSFTSALTYDFEVYSAAQERWLEVSSVSNFETFQTNRMKIRFKDGNGKTQLLHSLNGSSLALPRIMACILENHQTPEGIKIPEVLRPYFGKEMIS